MKYIFTLQIAEDVSQKEVALALRREASRLERTNNGFEEGDSGPVCDQKGREVGDWEIAL